MDKEVRDLGDWIITSDHPHSVWNMPDSMTVNGIYEVPNFEPVVVDEAFYDDCVVIEQEGTIQIEDYIYPIPNYTIHLEGNKD